MSVDEVLLLVIVRGDQDTNQQIELVEVDSSRAVHIQHVEHFVDLVFSHVCRGPHKSPELDIVQNSFAVDIQRTEELQDNSGVFTYKVRELCLLQSATLLQSLTVQRALRGWQNEDTLW